MYNFASFKITLFFIFIFLFLSPLFSMNKAKADVLLKGSQHIGDNYIDSYTPPDPVTNNQIEKYPSYFYLTDSLTVTEVRVSDLQGLDGDRLRVYIDGNFVDKGKKGESFVDIKKQYLEGNQPHTIAVRARCLKDDGKTIPCNSGAAVQDNDIAFSEITLISGGQTFSKNFLQRVHLGDWTDDDWYDPTDTYPYYPDEPQGESITLSFSLDETAYGLDLDFYRLRALDYVADIQIDGDDEGNLDPDSGETYNLDDPYSLSISKTLKPDPENNPSITISAGISGGNVDDFSWDELIITPKRLLTYYAMEEANWDGIQGEVADSTGNNHNATAHGEAETRIDDPAIPGVNGTCRYGTFDGNGDYLEDNDAANYLDGLSAITVMAWVKNTDEIGNDRGVFGTASPNVHDNRLSLRYDEDGASTGHNNLIKASINTNACDDNDDCLQVETESDLQVQDTWQHIAMTWRSGEKIRIYVDGTEVNTTVTSSGIGVHEGTLDGIDFLRVGQGVKDGNPSPYWQGAIDEFRIFSQDLIASQIQSIMNKTHPCDISPIDHFVINHDGPAVTCMATNVTFTAHDENHDPVNVPAGGTLSLSTNTTKGTWSEIVSGTGTLTDSTAGDGEAEYTFPGGESNSTLAFDYTELPSETNSTQVDIHAVYNGISEDSGNATSSEDPPLLVSRTGFVFINQTDDNQIIPTQISGKDSNQNPNAKALGLQAVKASDENQSVCKPVFSNEDVQVQLAAECRDPDTCSSRNLTLSNADTTYPIQTNDDNDAALTTSYTNATLHFESNSTAPIVINYPDAGKMQLHAKHEILYANGTASGNYMLGSSNQFVVRPFGFYIDVPDNPGATSASGNVFTTAGKDFNATLTAVVWESGDDTNDDGFPDSNTGLTDNLNTPNFGQEATPENATLTHHLFEPDSGEPGSLSGGPFTNFSEGNRTQEISWNEVGIISLNATLSDNEYLDSGQDVIGFIEHVGRFIPNRFLISDNSPGFGDGCTSFTYMGQEFPLNNPSPRFTITPVANNTDNTPTQNYDGTEGFWKLSTNLGNRTYSNNSTIYANATKGTNTSLIRSTNGSTKLYGVNNDYNGTEWITLSGEWLTYEKPVNSTRTFQADVYLDLNASDLTDSDGVCYDPDDDGICDSYRVSSINGTQLRYGRAMIENAYGSELLPLKHIKIKTQYYNSTSFQLNTEDSCSPYNASMINWSDACYGGNLTASNMTASGEGIVSNGVGEYNLYKQGNNTGYVDYKFPVKSWLKYSWNSTSSCSAFSGYNGTTLKPPYGRATFGIYKGNEHIIYQQETTWK